MPRGRPRQAVPGENQALLVVLPHRLTELRVGHAQHFEAQIVALAAAGRRLQIRPDRRAVRGGIGQRGLQSEFIAHLPRPDRGRMTVARHHLAHILAHPFMDFALRIAPLVHRFAHQIRHAGVIPEKRGDQPDAVFLGRGHHRIESPEVFLPVGAVKRHVLGPESRGGKTHKRNPLAGQHFEALIIARVRTIEQGPVETGKVVHPDGAEGFAVFAQAALAVAGEHRRRGRGSEAGGGQDNNGDQRSDHCCPSARSNMV